MNRKELLAQCQAWHEQDEYQKIIDALEAIPEKKRTCEIDMELARAYNNRAVSEEPVNRAMLKCAIALMEPYCFELEEDYSWNFLMGFAHYYLEQEGQARWYFEDALKLHPGNDSRLTSKEQIQELIDACEAHLALPDFRENFRQRTVSAWDAFAAREAELRRLIDADKIEEVLTDCREILHIAFENIAFEIGVGGKKPELILTPEGDRAKLFELAYFRRHAPAEVLEAWDIRLGHQPMKCFEFCDDDLTLSDEDVRVWVDEYKEGTVALTLYSEKLLPLLRDDEDNKDRVLWLAGTLVEKIVGEIPYMRYIAYLHVKGEPDKEPSVALIELPDKLEELGYDLSVSAEELLEIYSGYEMEPDNDPDAIWRADIIAGSSSCFPLIEDYMQDDVCSIDDLHADGAVAGFLFYPVDSFADENADVSTKKIFDFRDELENYIGQKAADAVTITGGATGTQFCYLDFIAWDLRAVLSAAKEFFENSDLTFAGFHVFCQGPDYVTLIGSDEDGDDEPPANIEDEVEYIPYTPENAEVFYKQLEQWNDADEFTRCIRVLETIPEEQRNYRFAYALARALENYAIFGDHENEPPQKIAIKALGRAIEILESVREEGKDKAEWNMRMAYAYQYLDEQEERAIPYAERWAELDPRDRNAKAVIRECKQEIKKRKKKAAKKKPKKAVSGGTPFAGFDFTGFWDDDDYALKEYVSEPPSDELIAEIEAELGYKLPAAYIWLMKQHNGGMPVNTCFPTDTPTSWAEDHVAITGIFGIGREKSCSLCGELGSQFMIDEWEYPAIGVAICDCPSAGHDMIFLDYRECGPHGEPKVVHIDQECDYEITPLADSFEEFIRGLVHEDEFDEYDD